MTVTIVDAAGRRVAGIADGDYPRGVNSAVWGGRDDAGRSVPSGLYFARVQWDGGEATAKLMLVR